MNVIQLICAIIALILLILAAFGIDSRRVGLFPLGMAFWLLAVVFVPLL
jgi:hypothetical protein